MRVHAKGLRAINACHYRQNSYRTKQLCLFLPMAQNVASSSSLTRVDTQRRPTETQRRVILDNQGLNHSTNSPNAPKEKNVYIKGLCNFAFRVIIFFFSSTLSTLIYKNTVASRRLYIKRTLKIISAIYHVAALFDPIEKTGPRRYKICFIAAW